MYARERVSRGRKSFIIEEEKVRFVVTIHRSHSKLTVLTSEMGITILSTNMLMVACSVSQA